jgi:mannitol-specific phosphotransferase system IIBC component
MKTNTILCVIVGLLVIIIIGISVSRLFEYREKQKQEQKLDEINKKIEAEKLEKEQELDAINRKREGEKWEKEMTLQRCYWAELEDALIDLRIVMPSDDLDGWRVQGALCKIRDAASKAKIPYGSSDDPRTVLEEIKIHLPHVFIPHTIEDILGGYKRVSERK